LNLKKGKGVLFGKIKIVLTFGLITLLSGCASVVDSMDVVTSIGQISVEKEVLNDSTTVRMTPAWLADGTEEYGLNAYKLGARWNSESPGTIILEPSYDSQVGGGSYTSFDGITIKVNGDSQRFDKLGRTQLSSSDYNTISNTIYTESTGYVPVPIQLVERMVEGEDVRLRVHSLDGYEDSIFSMDRALGGQGLARKYLRDFLNAVDRQSSP